MKRILTLIYCLAVWLYVDANIDSLIMLKIIMADSARASGNAEAALSILQEAGMDPAFSNATCRSKGNYYHKKGVYHYDLYQSRDALVCWRDSALQIRLACLGSNHEETANSYYAIALAYRDFSDKDNETVNIIRSVNILEMLPQKDPADLAYKYFQVGVLYNSRGDYFLAESYLLQALRNYRSIGYEGTELGELFNELGLTKNNQGSYFDALEYFTSAKTIFQKSGLKEQMANCDHNSSKSYYLLKDLKTAEAYASKAIRQYSVVNARRQLPHCYELMGNIKKKQKDYKTALRYFHKGLEYYIDRNDNERIANAYENIADVYNDRGIYQEALNHYQTAITFLIPSLRFSDSNDLPNVKDLYILSKTGLLRLLSLKGAAYYKKYEIEEKKKDLLSAARTYEAMDTLITRIRHDYTTPGSKFLLAQNVSGAYENAIKTQLALFKNTGDAKHLEIAYWFCAKNKVVVLLDGLQELNAKMSDIPDSLRLTEIQLKRNINQIEEDLFKHGKERSHEKEALRTKLFNAKRDYTKWITRLETDFPNYYNLKYDFPKSSDLADLQNQLPEDQVILEYFVGEKQLFIFLISRSTIKCFEKAKPANFDELCQSFRHVSEGTSVFSMENFLPLANSLYAVLLEQPLKEIMDKKRIIVVPSDGLLQFSFDNMLYRLADGADWGQLPFMIRKYAISTAYSSQLLFRTALLKKARKAEQLFGGYGLEYDDRTLKSIDSLGYIKEKVSPNRSMGKLVYSDDEVLEIADMVNGKAWVNEKATKSTFLENADEFKILHFAMHSIVNEKLPLQSSLIFFKESDTSDFILRASELYSIHLNAELVVLSACNTGDGSIIQGEGVRSLARAFTYSGSPGLVASLWHASDFSSKEILVAFYKYLKKGHPKDIALQYAKIEYLANAPPSYADPGFWSNLIVIGNNAPVEMKDWKQRLLPWAAGILILVGLAGGLWLRSNR